MNDHGNRSKHGNREGGTMRRHAGREEREEDKRERVRLTKMVSCAG